MLDLWWITDDLEHSYEAIEDVKNIGRAEEVILSISWASMPRPHCSPQWTMKWRRCIDDSLNQIGQPSQLVRLWSGGTMADGTTVDFPYTVVNCSRLMAPRFTLHIWLEFIAQHLLPAVQTVHHTDQRRTSRGGLHHLQRQHAILDLGVRYMNKSNTGSGQLKFATPNPPNFGRQFS